MFVLRYQVHGETYVKLTIGYTDQHRSYCVYLYVSLNPETLKQNHNYL